MQFDAEDHKDTGFDPLPKGTYPVLIDKVEMKQTKNGLGQYLQFELIVHGGTYNGRRLWYRCTIAHSESEQAVKIGLGQLSALSRSVGLPRWRSERELNGRFGEVVVGIDKSDPNRNEVTGWVVRDRAAQREPVSNPPKAAHYGGAAARPHGGPPPASYPGAGAHRPPQSYGAPPPQSAPPAPPSRGYPGAPAPRMAPPPQAPPEDAYESYEPPAPYDDGVPF